MKNNPIVRALFALSGAVFQVIAYAWYSGGDASQWRICAFAAAFTALSFWVIGGLPTRSSNEITYTYRATTDAGPNAGRINPSGFKIDIGPSNTVETIITGGCEVHRWRFRATDENPIDWRRIRKEANELAAENHRHAERIYVEAAHDGWSGRPLIGQRCRDVRSGEIGWDLVDGWQRYRGRVLVTVEIEPYKLTLASLKGAA
jgi:hypothetical protein